jgi:hypothetical protein
MVDPRVRIGFFQDKNRAFWILQGGGWIAYLMLRALSGLANSMGLAFVLLSVSNWTLVDFVLPDGSPASVPLPLLLAAAFLAGVIPTWAWHALLRPLAGKSRSRRPLAPHPAGHWPWPAVPPQPQRPGPSRWRLPPGRRSGPSRSSAAATGRAAGP